MITSDNSLLIPPDVLGNASFPTKFSSVVFSCHVNEYLWQLLKEKIFSYVDSLEQR